MEELRRMFTETRRDKQSGFELFAFCWLLIGIISAADLAFTVHYLLTMTELNPVAKVILDCGLSWFVFAKMSGTIATLGVLGLWWRLHRHTAWLASLLLAAIQITLMIFILWA